MSVDGNTQIIEVPMAAVAQSALTLVRPIAQPTDLIAYHEEITQIIQRSLTKGIDYDVVPGTGDKPSLMKPGAERLNLAFGAAPEYEITEKEIDHDREVRWTKKKKKWNNKFHGDKTFTFIQEEGVSIGLYRYVVKCRIVRAGRLLAECIGTCSTLESKYIDRPRDCENTALKMAQKRAFVGATLHAFGLSNRFTQDVEDNRDLYAKESPPPDVDIPSGSPPPNPAPKRGAGYDGSTGHQKILHSALKDKEVPEDYWEEINNKMIGRSFPDLDAVIQGVRQGAV